MRITGFDGKEYEGFLTSQRWVDEIRCLVASFYGGAYVKDTDGKFRQVLAGGKDDDIALRCCPYGRASAGDVVHNPRGMVHEPRNVGDSPARVAVTFVIDKGKQITQYLEK